MIETLKIGMEVVVVYRQRLNAPTKATIIAITNTPGKMVGVQFKDPIGIHTCDGRGPFKHCMWVHPNHLLTLERGEKLLKNEAKPDTIFALEIDHNRKTQRLIPQ